MEDTYKGESPGKKVARLKFWSWAATAIDATVFETRRHVVLASREGGDVGVLLAFGVPPKNIIAVDRNAEAAAACAAKWPEVDVRHCDLREAVESTPDIGVVFADLCAPLSRDTVTLSRDLLERLPLDGAFGVAFLRGREQDSGSPVALAMGNRKFRRIHDALGRREEYRARFGARGGDHLPLSHLTMQMVGGASSFAPRALHDATRSALAAEGHATRPGLVRALAWAMAMLHCCDEIQPEVDLVIDYQSATRASKGVPMTILCGRPHLSAHFERDKRGRIRCTPAPPGGRYASIDVTADEHEIRHLALSEQYRDVADLVFNLPAGTLAAWKAHETRRANAAVSPEALIRWEAPT